VPNVSYQIEGTTSANDRYALLSRGLVNARRKPRENVMDQPKVILLSFLPCQFGYTSSSCIVLQTKDKPRNRLTKEFVACKLVSRPLETNSHEKACPLLRSPERKTFHASLSCAEMFNLQIGKQDVVADNIDGAHGSYSIPEFWIPRRVAIQGKIVEHLRSR